MTLNDPEVFQILVRLTDVLETLEEVSNDLPSNALIEQCFARYSEKASEADHYDRHAHAYAMVAFDAIVALRSALADHLDSAVAQAEDIISQE